ncbi:hypothetical protein GTO89_08700 [Heliobacterium gestii]|uniref:Sulfotransferase domain-containing protein n=1 Tax=Heliomicrobium gestii TaxID=2699 RepID=A0A845LI33_HELGE|nr:sulfotransferase domain-containing protein [Heliomicrobium gestii]MBM7866607.1 hypothetical protein [Heliomicrobium gestii]MZP43113.1 hypothetical protein [Heliomicrobium gestii]
MNRIIVAEYPKSGGTWFVSLLGDALSLDKRDIYVQDGYDAFAVNKHPWYVGAASLNISENCVIKSHEKPGSSLHPQGSKVIHLVRDGRDVVVSKYFFERDFCVKNGIYTKFDVPFEDYVVNVASEWKKYVLEWLETDARLVRYEELLANPAETLSNTLDKLNMVVEKEIIERAIRANSKERLRSALDKTFAYNTFVRKGISGDWINHFSVSNRRAFHEVAGDVLIRLGYETNANSK